MGFTGVNHDLDSRVTYNWTEHVDEELKRTLADTIITINHAYSYHIEFQIDTDGSIIFRMLDYGFHHAIKNHTGSDVLEFPEPVVIYLYEGQSLPDERRLTIRFGSQGTFEYSVPVIKYLTLSEEELDKKKMIILIPFQLLKLRREFEKARTPENLEALKRLVSHDIIESISINLKAGNITPVDAQRLGQLTQALFHHIYDRYPEVAEKGVDDEVDDALILEIDIVEQEITQRVTKEVTKEVTEEVTKKVTAQKNAEILAIKLLVKGKTTEEILKQTGLSLAEIERPPERIRGVSNSDSPPSCKLWKRLQSAFHTANCNRSTALPSRH